jgi:hypothetical protein
VIRRTNSKRIRDDALCDCGKVQLQCPSSVELHKGFLWPHQYRLCSSGSVLKN